MLAKYMTDNINILNFINQRKAAIQKKNRKEHEQEICI